MSVTRNADICTTAPGPCRDAVTAGTLLWISGLDSSLCEAFELAANAFTLKDCDNSDIPLTTPLVTCSSFADTLCTALNGLPTAVPATIGVTALVGKDCNTYTIPETVVFPVPSASIAIFASGAFGHTLSANLIVSPDAGNALSIHPNGAYVPTTNFCQQVVLVPTGAPSIPNGTLLLGNDCQFHLQTQTPLVVTDTATINFTNSGTDGHDLTGSVVIDPAGDNLLTATGSGLKVDCDTVKTCVGIPFRFTSALSLTHVIVHGLNVNYPLVTVWDTSTGAVVIPASIVNNTSTILTITFAVPTAIAGSIY